MSTRTDRNSATHSRSGTGTRTRRATRRASGSPAPRSAAPRPAERATGEPGPGEPGPSEPALDASAPEPARRRSVLLAWLAAAVVVIAVIPVLVVLLGTAGAGEDGATSTGGGEPAVDASVGSQEYLDRLANQGYIPKEAVPSADPQAPEQVPPADLEERSRLLEQLANEGRIPSEATR
jgi:hypothetical protein